MCKSKFWLEQFYYAVVVFQLSHVRQRCSCQGGENNIVDAEGERRSSRKARIRLDVTTEY